MTDEITLDQALDEWNQIGDRRRAKQLLIVAFSYAIDYMISWEEFEKIVASLKKVR